MANTNLKYCGLLLAVLAVSACNITRLVPQGEGLLVKNKIVHETKTNVKLPDESDYIILKPNRKIFGLVKFHLWAYQSGAKGVSIGQDTGRIRKALIRIGEPPVLVDSLKIKASANNLSNYYFNKGFLDNSVDFEVKKKFLLRKRFKVIYNVELNEYRKVGQVEYLATSMIFDSLILATVSKSKLKQGNRLDFSNIQEERNRLTTLFKDNGFYYFNNSFIDFSVDTSQHPVYTPIAVNIRNDRNFQPHRIQKIHSVRVKIGSTENIDTSLIDGIVFSNGSYYINPEVLTKKIHFRPGDVYNATKVQKTYADLLGIGLFRFVTVRFNPSPEDSTTLLDAEISLQTISKHDFIWEPQAITTEQGGGIEAASERNYGIGNTITLRNRNVFGNAESINLNTSTSLETQFKGDNIRAFSNFRQSVSGEFIIPSLLYFDDKTFTNELSQKATKFTASYLYDRNVNYVRQVVPINYSHSFIKGRTSYSITPLRISYNNANVSLEFLDGLSPQSKAYINQLLTNNLIAGSTFSLYWSNSNRSLDRFWKIRTSPLEISGNMFSGYYGLFTNQKQINKTVLGVKYSQYIRSEIDASFTYLIDENHSLAYRAYLGSGLPYGNTQFLPFERRFFVGGGNSLRAWRPRTIGPGSFTDNQNSISLEKTGEIMIQGNFEYRFTVINNLLEAALFADAGNIWNFRKDPDFVGADFNITSFHKEIAFNTGMGFRWDLSYLIFRIDWGIALHDPSKISGERWVIKDFPTQGWIGDNSALNLAIGYPF